MTTTIHDLRNLPLEEVLTRLYGAEEDQHSRPSHRTRQWRLPGRSSTIGVTGHLWIDNASGDGGGGAIDLVMHLDGCDFGAAADRLRQQMLGGGGGSFPKASFPTRDRARLSVDPPAPDPPPSPDAQAWPAARAYLLGRGIRADVVDQAHDAGAVCASRPHGYVNVMLPLEGGGAFVRGTRGTFRRAYKPLGVWCWPGNMAACMAVAESPIDALAWAGTLTCAQRPDLLATVGNGAYKKLVSAIEARVDTAGWALADVTVCALFDRDAAGAQFFEELREQLERRVRRVLDRRPPAPAKDWADVALARAEELQPNCL